ncbi:MAG TPA: hypothetical protein VNZ26_24110, partial [Vicinamibacterales bacterium]|nr:hypothetical protein [Vicinamibacterales bacterium]
MRFIRRLAHVLVIVLALIVGAGAAAIVVSQTAWFKDWLRGYIVRQANQYLNGALSIERLKGNLWFGVEMENIGLTIDGNEVVTAKDLGLEYNVFQMVTRGISVSSIRLDRPVVHLTRDGNGWTLSRLVKPQQPESEGSRPGRAIAVNEIGVTDGSVVVDAPVGTSGVEVPKRVDNIAAKLAVRYEPAGYSIGISHISFRSSEPSLSLNALSGTISVRDDAVSIDKLTIRTAETSIAIAGSVDHYQTKPALGLTISSDRVSLPEISRVLPSLAGVALQPAVALELAGPLDRLAVSLDVRASAGQLTGRLVTDLVG